MKFSVPFFPTVPHRARPFERGFAWLIAVVLAFVLAAVPARVRAQDSTSLASKSIAHVIAVQSRVFALSEDGTAFSRLGLFNTPSDVVTGSWPYNAGAEGGAAWSNSLLLRSNYFISDSQRVARVTSLRFNATFRGGDSLIFRDRTDSAFGLADGAMLSTIVVRDTIAGSPARAVLGFGRSGIAYAALAAESSTSLFAPADSMVTFLGFPSASDTVRTLASCRWNRLCRLDTVTVPTGGLDSVITIALDSSATDSIWILVATPKGLRRGLWGGTTFPYVALPGIDSVGTAVRSMFTSPARRLAWVFTGTRYFFSDDHGATFRVPPVVSTISVDPSSISGYTNPPQAAFYGDTSIINFNRSAPGLILFRRDTILANTGTGFGQVLLDSEDGLEIDQGEGALTALTVARGVNPTQAVLVAGSTLKGVFHLRLDQPGTEFSNINRLKSLKSGLEEVITYPTLFTTAKTCGENHVRIGYRLKKDARVTITVYNYGMEKVKVIVKNAARRGGIARSESIADDRWDGCDESGRFVSVGTYYILVESDAGDKAFGKALVTRGRK